MKHDLSSHPASGRKLLGGFLWAVLLGLVSCDAPPPKLPDGVLAQSGGEVLTVAAFSDAMKRRGVHTEAAREALLEEMLQDLRVLNAARRAGLEKDPEIVAAHRVLLISAYRHQKGLSSQPPAEILEEEMQRYFNEHPKEFLVPPRMHVAMIFVAVSTKASPEARKKARERVTQAYAEARQIPPSTQPAHFGSLAVTYSDHQASRYQGGDLGFVSPVDERLPDSVFEATFDMEPGSLSDVLETEEGFYLTRLIEKTGESILPYQQAAPSIRARLQTANAQKREEAFARSLQATPIIVEKSRVIAIPLPVSAEASSKPPETGF